MDNGHNDKFVALKHNYTRGIYSTDGLTWTKMTVYSSKWSSVCYGNDIS